MSDASSEKKYIYRQGLTNLRIEGLMRTSGATHYHAVKSNTGNFRT